MEDATRLGSVIGKAVRALRAERGWSQQDVARGLGLLGLPWTRSQVAELETSRRDDVNVGELIVLAELFNVAPADFFTVAGENTLGMGRGGKVERPLDHVRRLLSGARPLDPGLFGPQEQPGLGQHGPYWTKPVGRGSRWYSALEVRTALRLGVYAEDVSEAADALWGQPIDEQLDENLGGTSAQDWPGIEATLVDDLGRSRELSEQLRRDRR